MGLESDASEVACLEIVCMFRSTLDAIVHGGGQSKPVEQMVPAFDTDHGYRPCSTMF
jgi:hypothetical protein